MVAFPPGMCAWAIDEAMGARDAGDHHVHAASVHSAATFRAAMKTGAIRITGKRLARGHRETARHHAAASKHHAAAARAYKHAFTSLAFAGIVSASSGTGSEFAGSDLREILVCLMECVDANAAAADEHREAKECHMDAFRNIMSKLSV